MRLGSGRAGKHGRGLGLGLRMGWFGVGYAAEEEPRMAATYRSALEGRVRILKAELARAESALEAQDASEEREE